MTAPIDIRPTGRTSRRRRTLSSSLCSSSFEDQYTLDQSGILGEGAYGMVYKCTHRITDLQYAVKIVDKRLGARRQKVFTLFYSYSGVRLHFQIVKKWQTFFYWAKKG